MFHVIEFQESFDLDVAVSPKKRLELVHVHAGQRVAVDLIPYVIRCWDGFVEVADLCFEDGSMVRCIPYRSFRFIDSD